MPVITSGVLQLYAKNYSGAGDWLDESGNGIDFTPNGDPVHNVDHFELDGAGDFFEAADNALLDFDVTDDFTVMVRARAADVTPGARSILFAKKIGTTGTAAGFNLELSTTGAIVFRVADGAVVPNDIMAGSVTDDVTFVAAGVRNTTDDDLEAFVDGIGSGTPTADTNTLTSANAEVIRVGSRSGASGNLYTGDVFDVVVWARALSDHEVATATDELIFGVPRRAIRSPRYGITRMARR